MRAKLKSYQGKINTNFRNNEMSKEGSQVIFLSVIFLFICFIYLFVCLFVQHINSAFGTGKNYYPQLFLEECKVVVKRRKFKSILLTT